jgi:cobalt-zinc-cadmium efflux system outer membrane protein
MNIDLKDAEIVQAGLWDNPELSINQINVWHAGKEKQFSIELSQLIQTANKRRKSVNKEQASKEIAVQELEEVLRDLKVDLRKSVYELLYLQSFHQVLKRQAESFDRLIPAYKRQVEQNNVAKTELLRLQSFSLALENDINEAQSEINALQRLLKSLLNLDYVVILEIEDANDNVKNTGLLSLNDLIEYSIASRPDLRRQEKQVMYYEKSLVYEKSLRVPDITLNAAYDRHGGVWKDFAGVGISFGLPFFNRNQGGIKAAKIGRDQSQYLLQRYQNTVVHEVTEVFENYRQARQFYETTNKNELLSELDGMLEVYTSNLLNKNVSMLEYIDFMDTYKTNKQIVLMAKKQLNVLFEELQYVVGNYELGI